MIHQHPYRGLMVLVEARPEGPDVFRPVFAVAERAEVKPMHSDLLDMTCETVTLALARAREAGELWIDAQQAGETRAAQS